MTDFEAFWKSYPRKVGRLNAERAWRVLKPNTQTVVAILAAVEWQSRSRQWQDIQFVPYPASWLRAGRWLDEPERGTRHRHEAGYSRWVCSHQPHCGSASICANREAINAARREAGRPEL